MKINIPDIRHQLWSKIIIVYLVLAPSIGLAQDNFQYISALTFYDPITAKIAVVTGERGAFLRAADDSWSELKTINSGGLDKPSADSCGAWDSKRNRGIAISANRHVLVDIDFETEQMSSREFTPTGATEITNNFATSAFYDELLDVYWIFGGGSDFAGDAYSAEGWDNLYRMNAETFQITKIPLSGDTIEKEKQRGSYGRFVFLRQARAIGLVAGVNQPAYVIKLPGESKIPKPPSGLRLID